MARLFCAMSFMKAGALCKACRTAINDRKLAVKGREIVYLPQEETVAGSIA